MNIPGYIIERELGHGGMSTVYLAEQESLALKVALKVMAQALAADRNFGERFLREARTVAQLSHPNILAVYDVGSTGSSYYLAMEYVPGGDLKHRIRQGALPPEQALTILCQIAKALGYAHQNGFVHRDVKPENILFRADGTVVLTDFGIAKALGSGTKMTGTGMTIGTAHYMSPEQAQGRSDIDGRSDLYSLGVVLYEMLTGRVPFDADNTIGIAMHHVQTAPPALPSECAACQPLLDRLLAKSPDERFASAGELIATIEVLQSGKQLKSQVPKIQDADPAAEQIRVKTQVMSTVRPTEPVKGSSLKWVIGGVVLALLVVGGVWLSLQPPQPSFGEAGTAAAVKDYPDSVSSAMPDAGGLTEARQRMAIVEQDAGTEPVRGKSWTDNTTGMQFAWVPGGCFQMGCGSWQNECDDDEKPVHEVCLDGYWMGRSEVTQGQWQQIMGGNPSRFKNGSNYPVEKVSWNDARDFIRRLNQQSGTNYRLPTEAEWEYAARSAGKEELYAGSDSIDAVAWSRVNSGGSTHPVMQKRPNGLGLYDMSGNVWEWCQDLYGREYYGNSPRNNPQGPSLDANRVNRGGGWVSKTRLARSTLRNWNDADDRRDFIGFRLALPSGQ